MTAYSNLSGDLDARPTLLRRLNALARRRGEHWTITSGRRTLQEQASVKPTYGIKAAATPFAPHVLGIASDVTIGGRPIWEVVPVEQLHRAGLTTFPGGESSDPVHVEIAGGRLGQEPAGKAVPASSATSGTLAAASTGDGSGPSGLLVFFVKLTAVLGGSALAVLGLRRATGIGQEVAP